MRKIIRIIFVLSLLVTISFLVYKSFKKKTYKTDINKLLKIEKFINERDEIYKFHKNYIKALRTLKSKVKQIGERITSKVAFAKITGKNGKLLAENKLWELAIKNYEIGLEVFPQDPALNYNIGVAYANLGLLYFEKAKEYWTKAKNFYKKAIKFAPNYTESYYALARLYLIFYEKNIDKKTLPKALTNINIYANKMPQNPKAYFLQGRIFYNMDKKASAKKSYSTILGLVSEKSSEYRNAFRNIKQIESELHD